MSDLRDDPAQTPLARRQYLIGSLDPAALGEVAAALENDPQTRVLPSPVPELLTVETLPAYADEIRTQLTARFPGVVVEENLPLTPLG